MFTVRTKTYRSQNNWQVTASGLDKDVEPVAELGEPFFSNTTVNTDKPWVGRIDNKTKEFEVIRVTPSSEISPRISRWTFLNYIFLTIFVQGSLVEEGADNKITIRFGIPWLGVLGFTLIYALTILLVINAIVSLDLHALIDLSIPLLFAIPLTWLVLHRVNKTEREITALLGCSRTKRLNSSAQQRYKK